MLSFTEFINEGKSFIYGGKKYSSGFGRYTCDGKSISKEEYLKISDKYKFEKKYPTPEEEKPQVYTPTAKEIKNRNQEPEVEHDDKKGTYKIALQVNPKMNRGSGAKSIEVQYKTWMDVWYKTFATDENSNGKTDKESFKNWFKTSFSKPLKELLDTSITTNKERKTIFNDFIDVMNDYIDDNFDSISKPMN